MTRGARLANEFHGCPAERVAGSAWIETSGVRHSSGGIKVELLVICIVVIHEPSVIEIDREFSIQEE